MIITWLPELFICGHFLVDCSELCIVLSAVPSVCFYCRDQLPLQPTQINVLFILQMRCSHSMGSAPSDLLASIRTLQHRKRHRKFSSPPHGPTFELTRISGAANSYIGGPVLGFHHATWGNLWERQSQWWWCCDVGRATTTKATTVLSVHTWRFVSLTPALGKHLYFDITTSQPLS